PTPAPRPGTRRWSPRKPAPSAANAPRPASCCRRPAHGAGGAVPRSWLPRTARTRSKVAMAEEQGAGGGALEGSGTARSLELTRDPRVTLPDLVEVLLNKGVYLNLDLIIAVADIPLIGIN